MFQEYENLMLGLIIIVSMVFKRNGIVPMARKLIERTR
jgi:branched-chain amino acid transport system permease protein